MNRRGFLGVCSMVGLGQTLLPGALFTLATQAKAQSSPIVGGGEVKANTAPGDEVLALWGQPATYAAPVHRCASELRPSADHTPPA